MFKQKQKIRMSAVVLAAASCGWMATPAGAQQQQVRRAPQQASGRAPQSSDQPTVRQQVDPSINDAAVVMQRRGGSLLRATLAATPPSGGASNGRPAPVSFYDIPQPEPKLIRKHDLVTIVVREASEFSISGKTDTKRDSALEAKVDEFIKLRLQNFELEGGALGTTPPSAKLSGSRSFKGEGKVDRTESLTTRVTAEVVDVKPNGTLVLQARKTIKTDDEEQSIVLAGTCRVEDIVADNTILSTQLYDLRIEKTHAGAVRDATKRTWLGQILDAILPF